MFPPHMEHCPVCKQYVRLDQTQQECAEEHRCERPHCPLRGYFHYQGAGAAMSKKEGTPSDEQ